MSPLPQSDTGDRTRTCGNAARSASPCKPETSRRLCRGRKKQRGSCVGSIDAGICLYVAVILFRTFEIEGYIISTGSMAPHLLGLSQAGGLPGLRLPVHARNSRRRNRDGRRYHRRARARDGPGQVRCPNCGEDRDRYPVSASQSRRSVARSKKCVRVSPAAPLGSRRAEKPLPSDPLRQTRRRTAQRVGPDQGAETSTSTARSAGRISPNSEPRESSSTTTTICPMILRRVRAAGRSTTRTSGWSARGKWVCL